MEAHRQLCCFSLLDACCSTGKAYSTGTIILWQKRGTNILLFKENTPFNYSTFLNQSVLKKNKRLESLLLWKARNKHSTPEKAVLIVLPPANPKNLLGNDLTCTVKIAINILFPNFRKPPGIHLKSDFANHDQKIMNWKHFLRNNVKDNFVVLILLCLTLSHIKRSTSVISHKKHMVSVS